MGYSTADIDVIAEDLAQNGAVIVQLSDALAQAAKEKGWQIQGVEPSTGMCVLTPPVAQPRGLHA